MESNEKEFIDNQSDYIYLAKKHNQSRLINKNQLENAGSFKSKKSNDLAAVSSKFFKLKRPILKLVRKYDDECESIKRTVTPKKRQPDLVIKPQKIEQHEINDSSFQWNIDDQQNSIEIQNTPSR
jgi:hypothetical protein